MLSTLDILSHYGYAFPPFSNLFIAVLLYFILILITHLQLPELHELMARALVVSIATLFAAVTIILVTGLFGKGPILPFTQILLASFIIVIAIEPEPGLTYERSDEVIAFFTKFFPSPESRRHLGVNFDICHQLVEFEDPAASVAALEKAGVRITKIHVSNCIEVTKPLVAPELLEALRRGYAESKFLHQTAGADAAGRVVYFSLDLPEVLTPDGLHAMAHAGVETLRIHYHMPLLPGGAMPTTLPAVESFVRDFARSRTDVPLVIETYTWLEHLPAAGGKRQDLPANIAAEIAHVRGWL